MPHCFECGEPQNTRRTINPSSKLCTECIKICNVTIGESVKDNNNVTTNDGMNEYSNTHVTVASNNGVGVVNNENNCIELLEPTTPISGLSTGNLISIIHNAVTNSFKSFEEKNEQSINTKLGIVDKDLTEKLSLLENQVKILESDNEKKTEENGILRNIM